MTTQLAGFFIRFIADFLVIPVVIIGSWLVLASPPAVRWQRIKKGVFAGALSLVLAGVAHLLYQDPRPFAAAGVAPRASYLIGAGFPSLHVLLVFTATFVVWAATKNVWAAVVMLLLSILVAVGRVVALVHTPLDVAGGIACALLAVLLVYGKTIFTPKLSDRS